VLGYAFFALLRAFKREPKKSHPLTIGNGRIDQMLRKRKGLRKATSDSHRHPSPSQHRQIVQAVTHGEYLFRLDVMQLTSGVDA